MRVAFLAPYNFRGLRVPSAHPTVLLTGATGFLGSHLLRGLLERRTAVVILKRSSSDNWRINELLSEVTSYDIDHTPLGDVFASHAIDVVIHAATAYGRKGESVSELLEANVQLPMRLLEHAAASRTSAFFSADSFSTKGAELPEGLEYYTLSKRHFSEYGRCFAKANPIQFTNVQIEHMYGPNDDRTKFVPTAIRALNSNQSVFELTPGEQRRDFVHVDDVVAAFLTLLDERTALPYPTAHVEVGCGVSHSLADAVQLLHQLCASETRLQFGALPYRKGELMASRADTTMLKELGWSARIPLREGLQQTVAAERSRFAGAEPRPSRSSRGDVGE
jgi:CDP-paratose synthetase